MPKIMLHDPQAVLDYAIDWTPWLQAGETITGATWTLPTDPSAPVRATGQTDTLTGNVATIWLTGGTPSQAYDFTCHATTSLGREDDRTITLLIEER